MAPLQRLLPVLALVALIATACGSEPVPGGTPAPSGGTATAAPSTSAVLERPFRTSAWSPADPACAGEGQPLLARVEAPDARTVRFTLCRPDGTFLSRIAHPSLGIVDAAAAESFTGAGSATSGPMGAGPYRVESWIPGDNLRLARVAADAGELDAVPTIILRWEASPAARLAALRTPTVDAIEDPATAERSDIDTMPELAAKDRTGLATAYLGFGGGPAFRSATVRRAFAQGIDASALASAAFPPGSTGATHVAPCVVPNGCAGDDWYTFNGPAGAAALDQAGFDRKTVYPLFVPDAPVAGLPDPATTAEMVRAQLADGLGVQVEVTPMPAAELVASVASDELRGLYLGGLVSQLADASGFLEPLFGAGATGAAAARAKGVPSALDEAATASDPAGRTQAFTTANDAIRTTVPLVPLVHAGSGMAFRADVTGATTSPLRVEALGTFVPGDRHQLVLMQAAEPAGTWCAATAADADLRLCALVTPGLYAFAPGTLRPVPALATRCSPNRDATTWTCRLGKDLQFVDGASVDAADVVASLRAMGDPGSALRRSLPAGTVLPWDMLFGPGAAKAGTPGPSASPSAAPSASLNPSAGPTPSPAPGPSLTPSRGG